MVVDADSVVDSNFLLEAVRLFRAGADGVQARYLVLNPEASLRTRLMQSFFMAFNVLRARGRERMGLSVGIFGNGFGLTKATLEAIPYDSHSIVEDLDYHLQLVQAGRKIVFVEGTHARGEMPAGGRGASTNERDGRAGDCGRPSRICHASLPELLRESYDCSNRRSRCF